jgi:hypothetical protein
MKTITKQIQWTATKAEFELIRKIAARAVAIAEKHGADYTMQDAIMDLEACHCNGMPLDLEKLLAADNFNLTHDCFGIRRHINRSTGEIGGFFVPRCARPTRKAQHP